MGSLFEYLLLYTLGGITFPLVLIATLFVHAYIFLPKSKDNNHHNTSDNVLQSDDKIDLIHHFKKSSNDKIQQQAGDDMEVASGYFTVSRDFIPGGVNGRPPERTTPLGSTTVFPPSQSVYQSMYRSIFERRPSVNHGDKSTGRLQKKKGCNVFYVVLRHGHLLLFDDDEQLEVRHVVSLAHYDVSIYSGGGEIPEGELFIKRNALCLSRRSDPSSAITSDEQASKPFFLFSENCSDKEDFYFALLRSQENRPTPLRYEIKDIIALVQKIHSSEENLQTRWLNAVMGRVFLALYKTPEIENWLRAKIKKKISRAKTPGFLSKISLRNIDMGDSAPIITNPKLRDLTVNGEVVIEADVRYSGNFRIEVAAAARIDLGTRFKAREVNLVLAVNFKRIEGHILLKIKPPPSNRFWICFQSQPRIDMSIEPIVSSRQITYTLILRQIENRIKEGVAESLVFPNWDDSPFFRTERKSKRGGIWADDIDVDGISQKEDDKKSSVESDPLVEKGVTEISNIGDNVIRIEREEADSSPPDADTCIPKTSLIPPKKSNLRRPSSVISYPAHKTGNSSDVIDTHSHIIEKSSSPFRSGSFPSSSSPIVGTDSTTADAFKVSSKTDHSHAIAAFSALSQISSPASSLGSNPPTSKSDNQESHSSLSYCDPCSEKIMQSETHEAPSGATITIKSTKYLFFPSTTECTSDTSPKLEGTPSKSLDTNSRRGSSTSSTGQSSTTEFRRLSLATMNNAAATAKKWSLSAFQRNIDQKNDNTSENGSFRPLVMGRGQPLPPPGVPLPPPGKKLKTVPIPVPKRRIPTIDISQKPVSNKLESSTENTQSRLLSPFSTTRKRLNDKCSVIDEGTDDSLLTVPVPTTDSEESLTENEQSGLTTPKTQISKNETGKQKLFKSHEEKDYIMTNKITRPKSDTRNVLIENINP